MGPEVVAQETHDKDQHQQEQPRPGQPEALSLLQQSLGGERAGAVVRGRGQVWPPRQASSRTPRVRGQPPRYPRGRGGSKGRWGRDAIRAKPRVCQDRDLEQRVGWGGPGAGTLQVASQGTTS